MYRHEDKEVDFGQIENCKDCYFYLEKDGVQMMNIIGCLRCNKYRRINMWQPIYKHEED